MLQYFLAPFPLTTFWGVLWQAILSGGIGILVYGGILYALKNEDITLFAKTLHSKFWKTRPINDDQPDL